MNSNILAVNQCTVNKSTVFHRVPNPLTVIYLQCQWSGGTVFVLCESRNYNSEPQKQFTSVGMQSLESLVGILPQSRLNNTICRQYQLCSRPQPRRYTVLLMFRQLLFWAGNQGNHQNAPSLLLKNFLLIFITMKQKKIFFEKKKSK